MLSQTHKTSSEITSTGTTYLMITSHQPPRSYCCWPLLTISERKRAGPNLMTAKDIKAPEASSPTDHTKSWLARISTDRAEGIPSRKPAAQIKPVAFLREISISTKTRLASSIMEISELKAAKVSPRKKRMAKIVQPAISLKSCGIYMKVRPGVAGPVEFMIDM